ncbi:hypothetical protein [Streptomyces sp. NPDC088115]|uniref:hypothetical protein n=1 Tax=Streptomyces sp. NPDC088115 TaxID=3365824 RepID=UPI00382F8ACC
MWCAALGQLVCRAHPESRVTRHVQAAPRLKKRPHKLTGKRERTAIYDTGKRYRVKGLPGIQDRSFHTSEDAKQ